MERSDKYYIAICNKTGLIAIYNPAKNLFMSPMADGPLKYVGSLSGKDMHVENITKYGRSFSIVKVPYTFKLLIQELQTINIQLRIITEDNIKQFDNLSFSKNIEKLTYTNQTNVNAIIHKINDKIGNVKKIKPSPNKKEMEEYELEDIIHNFTIPEIEPMPYNSFNDSPGFNPYTPPTSKSPPYAPISINGDSPPFIPLEDNDSPPYAPTSAKNDSPPYAPTSAKNDSPPYAEDPKYNEGDVVNYRGGGPHKYKIKKMTPHFATLDAMDPNTPPSEMVKVVKIADLYDAPIHNPYMSEFQFQQQDPYDHSSQALPYAQHYGSTSTPNITLSPVIKIVNGDDKSTNIKDESVPANETHQYPNVQNMQTLPINILKTETEHPQNSQKNDNDSQPIDFSKILIKKV
jgi:hypothetical protein